LVAGLVKERDFLCPHGVTSATALIVQTEALAAIATTPDQLKEAMRQRRQDKTQCCGQKSYDDHETDSGNKNDNQAEGATESERKT